MTTPYRVREEPVRDLAPVAPRPLGRMRSTHTTGATARRVLVGMTAIAGVLTALGVAWPGVPWLVGVALLCAFAVGTWIAIASVLGLDIGVDVHDGGIVVHRSWRRPLVLPFDDVTRLHVVPGVAGAPTVALELEDGRRTSLPLGGSEGAAVRSAIEGEIERPVLDDALRAFASGQHLTFGDVVLELEGIRHRGDLLPWHDLDRVVLHDGGFVFVQKATQHAFVVLATSTIPFPRVLVALLDRRVKIEADDPFWTRFV